MPSKHGRAALAYAGLGVAVFPIRPGTKEPYPGSKGENDGTTDLEQIERTWHRLPNADVGAALRYTPYFITDVDARHYGDEWLAALEAQHQKLPATAMSISGSGNPGAHYWFRRTPDLEDVRCRKLCEGVDVKGLRAGYVVLPPSRHPSGNLYQWEASSRLGEVPIAEPPAWLVRMLREQRVREYASHTASVAPESFYLGLMFKIARMLKRQVRPGVFAVECPNEGMHSERGGDSSTVIFAPPKPGGRGTFFCAHTSACSEVLR